MRTAVVWLAGGFLVSCGVVGAPVPPESVGVAPTIERQQKQQEAFEAVQGEEEAAAVEEVSSDPALQGQDVNLPPLQPVGTR